MIAGTTAGRKIRRRICSEPAPSIIAASSSSLRHRLEAVAHDVQAERQLDRGVHDRQADQRVGQPEVGEHQEQRCQQRLVGDDQGEQQQDEQRLLERDREASQPVAGERREERRVNTTVSSAVPRLLMR